jgi:magnesium-transporting ATPase (P-type)
MGSVLARFKKRKARVFYPEVILNSPADNEGQDFPPNRISSTKYSVITFLPKNLYEQFRRITNFYFLIIAIVSLIPSITPFNPATTWGPLIFVLAVSAVKDAIEDIGRWRSDNQVNNREVEVLRNGKFVKVRNKEVCVGDVVCVKRDEECPADAVILATSDPDGIAFVDTANLDGETNLKSYKSRPETKMLKRKELKRLSFKISATINTPNLYKFQGNIELIPPASEEVAALNPEYVAVGGKLALDEKNLLLRGSRLRNTKECYAGVVYAGLETKVQLNANNPPSKFAMTEKIINRVVLTIFTFKMLACAGCGLANFLFERQYAPQGASIYLPTDGSPVWRGFLTFLAYFALFSYFIPISLIVTLEVAKLVQAVFMMWDVQMINEEGLGMTVKNSNLNDELARVGYIFCDKTGTLTENRMVFDKASINGIAYRRARHRQLYKLLKSHQIHNHLQKQGGQKSSTTTTTHHGQKSQKKNIEYFDEISPNSQEKTRGGIKTTNGTSGKSSAEKTSLMTKESSKAMVGPPASDETAAGVLDFVLLLAVANTSQVEYYNPEEEEELKKGKGKKKKKKNKKKGGGQEENGEEMASMGEEDKGLTAEEEESRKAALRTSLRYQAQSPDEICLCNFARDNGVILKERRNTELVVEVLGEEKVYEILQIMEFTSDRRRMSVILREPSGKIVLYSKGADSIMMARLSPKVDEELKRVTQSHIDEFSLEGLRTLICGKKELSEEEYKRFEEKYSEALALIEGRDEKVEELSDSIERDLELVGCTAIEDKLQDGVPEAIAYFIAGGIKVWIITGDKQATAINIAKSCNLIQTGVTVVIVNAGSDEECNLALDDALKVVNAEPRVALVIDGPSLPFAFACGSKLLAVSQKCEAVVVCRATPLQKALVVRMIKRGTNELTLSVGDGANDVSMLQEAHIGVGIYGKEGSQAARSGDYAIYMYKHLKRLVCIHGRYNLLRSSALIQFCYYKNLAMFLVQLWFSFFNGFSSQPIYEAFTMAVFNVIITSAPPLLIGIFERDVRERMLERFPQAHRQVRQGEGGFTYKNFLVWICFAIYHSLVIFFIPFFAWWPSPTSPSGRDTNFWELGMTTFIGGFFTVILKIALFSQWWIWLIHLGMWGSIVVFFILFWILSSLTNIFPEMINMFYIVWSNPVSVFCFFLVPILALLPDFLYTYVRRNYFPRDHHILQELDFASDDERLEKIAHMDQAQLMSSQSLNVLPPDIDSIRRTAFIDDLPSDRRNAEIALAQHEQLMEEEAIRDSEEMAAYQAFDLNSGGGGGIGQSSKKHTTTADSPHTHHQEGHSDSDSEDIIIGVPLDQIPPRNPK